MRREEEAHAKVVARLKADEDELDAAIAAAHAQEEVDATEARRRDYLGVRDGRKEKERRATRLEYVAAQHRGLRKEFGRLQAAVGTDDASVDHRDVGRDELRELVAGMVAAFGANEQRNASWSAARLRRAVPPAAAPPTPAPSPAGSGDEGLGFAQGLAASVPICPSPPMVFTGMPHSP